MNNSSDITDKSKKSPKLTRDFSCAIFEDVKKNFLSGSYFGSRLSSLPDINEFAFFNFFFFFLSGKA